MLLDQAPLHGCQRRRLTALQGGDGRVEREPGTGEDGADQGRYVRPADPGVAALVDYFTDLLREKRRHPGEDLIDLLLRAEHEGHTLGSDEIVSNIPSDATIRPGSDGTFETVAASTSWPVNSDSAWQTMPSSCVQKVVLNRPF